MGTIYNRSYSLASVFRAGPACIDVDGIHDQVHVLDESVQKQLKKADQSYIELQEGHKKEKEQWNQLLESME